VRLIRASIDNYRVHERVEVEFDPRTSLLGGLNEAGKSTIVEAIHRALFLPAKGNTQVHKGMQREGAGERPEVRLRFEQDGEEWELHKRFGGTSAYTATLRQSGRPPLEGDAAEQRLAELTGAALPTGKRATDESVRQPWSHLWVWQGAAGDDPTTAIHATTDELVRITAQGAGAMMMSETDTRLAERFRQEREAVYGATTRAKAASALGKAQARNEALQAEGDALAQRVADLAADADRHAEALQRLASAEPRAQEVTSELAALTTRIETGRAVQQRLERAAHAHQELQTRLEDLKGTTERLERWGAEAATLAERLDTDRHAQRLSTAAEQARQQRDRAHAARDSARDALPALLEARDRIEARVRLLHADRALTVAGKAAARVSAIDEALTTTRAALGALPSVSSRDVTELRQLADALHTSERELDGVTSTLQVLHHARGTDAATLDGCPLCPGEPIALNADSMLNVGEALSLRLIVPAAVDAGRRRTAIAEQRAALARSLSRFVIDGSPASSVDRLAELLPHRQVLSEKCEDLQRQLAAEDPDGTRAELVDAEHARQSAQALDAQLPDPPDWTDPEGLDDAQRLLAAALEAQREHERQLDTLATRSGMADTALSEALREQSAHADTRRADEDRLRELRAYTEERLREHGGDRQAVQHALEEMATRQAQAAQHLGGVQAEVEALALDVLETRCARLREQGERLRTATERARDDVNESRGRLHQPDGSDPDSELRDTRERQARAHAELMRETLDARASTLLDTLYQQGLDTANDAVTRPLADTVSHYLRYLFGTTASVNLRYTDGAFGEFYLFRPGFAEHEEPFSSLSGGAREQVAAAVRLATAELLATRYGGTLPVVFDDAFVNTDPGRIEKVIDMLFQAGERGLQVIVSTCDPERYQNIGQRQWTVDRGQGAREG